MPPLASLFTRREAAAVDLRQVHDAHADFVFASLQRAGIRDSDLEDLLQEVFVVVHRKLGTFDGTSKMTTWLFSIVLRVAAAHHRRAYVRRERPTDDIPEAVCPEKGPEDAALDQEARRRLERVLDTLDVEKRAIFVMYEIEGMPCEDIANLMGVPVGTVYSRLHHARKEFESALQRDEKRGKS